MAIESITLAAHIHGAYRLKLVFATQREPGIFIYIKCVCVCVSVYTRIYIYIYKRIKSRDVDEKPKDCVIVQRSLLLCNSGHLKDPMHVLFF